VLLEAPLRHLERPEHLLVEGILDIGMSCRSSHHSIAAKVYLVEVERGLR
jgi:hypothetical protein